MDITIMPRRLSGTITPPPSKSLSHRFLIGAGLADGESVLSGMGDSQDIQATASCMQALGAEVERKGSQIQVTGAEPALQHGSLPVLDCGESGSTLRFLIPVALALRGGAELRGHGRLLERPLDPYRAAFQNQDIQMEQTPEAVFVSGTLRAGRFSLPGDVSSQFISGLLFALPLLEGESEIVLTAPLASSSYVVLTEDTLRAFGISFTRTRNGWIVPGGQKGRSVRTCIEADYSQAAFFLTAAAIGSDIKVEGLKKESHQGDRAIIDLLKTMQAPGEITLSMEDCPDLVPPVAVRAAFRNGDITHITGAGRLRLKESDRLAAMADVLSALGADILEEPDGLTIRGKATLRGGAEVSSWNDHRIAMAAAIAATRCQEKVTVRGADCVAKSYPAFWQDYAALGGQWKEA